MQELGDDQVRDVLGHGRAEEDDALVEEARVDVEGALAARGLLDDHWDQWAHVAFPAPRAWTLDAWSRFTSEFRRRAAILATGISRPGGVSGPRMGLMDELASGVVTPDSFPDRTRDPARATRASVRRPGWLAGAGSPQLR